MQNYSGRDIDQLARAIQVAALRYYAGRALRVALFASPLIVWLAFRLSL